MSAAAMAMPGAMVSTSLGGLRVSGVGMATSLGDTVTSAAAYRAGLARPSRWSWDDGGDASESVPSGTASITGHRVRPVSAGFEQASLWVRMARAALEDLPAQGPADAAPAGTLVLLAVPGAEAARFGWSASPSPATLGARILAPFLEAARLPTDRQVPPQLFAGPAAFSDALSAAEQAFARRLCGRALLVVADALTDDPSLRWLDRQQRLKHGDRPVGLIPGEGAVCLALERAALPPSAGHAGHPAPSLSIDQWLASVPPDPGASPSSSRALEAGQRLGQALSHLLATLPPLAATRGECDLYLDLNGEPWKSEAWGHALHRLAGKSPAVADHWQKHAFFPATSFGDVGIVHAPLSLALAQRAWLRRYAGARHAIVASVAADGLVSALTLRAAANG